MRHNVSLSNSVPGIYSVDNASERDFLRTEGDPAALGYTIKEALALTRSVVGYVIRYASSSLTYIDTKALQSCDLYRQAIYFNI